MSKKNPVVKMYHVKYVADMLVPATSTREAFARGDEELMNMVGDVIAHESGCLTPVEAKKLKYKELDQVFDIAIENETFHIVPEVSDEEDEEDDESESDTGEDEECDGNCEECEDEDCEDRTDETDDE